MIRLSDEAILALDPRRELGRVRAALEERLSWGGPVEPVLRALAEKDRVAVAELMVGPRARKDPAMVAAQALKFASSEGHDVVLIDTAGRMQNNAPLMEALARLVFMNTPDLVLFVGEALVGNDGETAAMRTGPTRSPSRGMANSTLNRASECCRGLLACRKCRP